MEKVLNELKTNKHKNKTSKNARFENFTKLKLL